MRIHAWSIALCVPIALVAVDCVGSLGGENKPGGDGTPGGAEPGGSTPGGTAPADAIGMSAARRLTRDEYDNTVNALFGDTSRPGHQLLPEDLPTPFDNDYRTQLVSAPLIAAVETLAINEAERAVSDPAGRAKLVGCTPSGPGDAACFRTFVTTFGRRALRRPMTGQEVSDYVGLQSASVEDGDFYSGVKLVIQGVLQEIPFLYRVETGAPVDGQPGTFRLSGWERASRLSFFLLGTTPDDDLLDAAEGGQLEAPEQLRAAALRLLSDPRAKDHIDRFHAMWLGYDTLPEPPALTQSMREETKALVTRVIFERQGSWFDVFRSTDAYIDSSLAAIYQLPDPGASGPAWVPYGGTGRKGILSTGSFLSVNAKFGDTSPTRRGKLVRNSLLCQAIPPPPPDVNVDQKPTSMTSHCKTDIYKEHATAGCVSCHHLMDPIGFGLEQFDQTGAFRTHDTGAPDCPLDGKGSVSGVGDFQGPAGLSELLAENAAAIPVVGACVATQVFRYAMGRQDDDTDAASVRALQAAFVKSGYRFDQLLLDVVSAPGFGFRTDDPGTEKESLQ